MTDENPRRSAASGSTTGLLHSREQSLRATPRPRATFREASSLRATRKPVRPPNSRDNGVPQPA